MTERQQLLELTARTTDATRSENLGEIEWYCAYVADFSGSRAEPDICDD